MNYTSTNMRMWSRLGPSGSLGVAAVEIGKEYEKTLFLTADMTFAAGLERFKNSYPDRLYDVGIAEQNLIGIATGFASEGFSPFAVTYATFFATRAFSAGKYDIRAVASVCPYITINFFPVSSAHFANFSCNCGESFPPACVTYLKDGNCILSKRNLFNIS